VPECDAPVAASDDFQRRRLSVAAEIEAGRRRDVRMSPAIEDDPGDVAARIEARRAEQGLQLAADLDFEVGVARSEQAPARGGNLPGERYARLRKADVERQHRGLFGIERGTGAVDDHRAAHVDGE